jgi:hypothetical protein
MNIKWIAWMAGVFLAVIALPAMAWRCPHGFAEPGDAASMVRQKCGTPDFIYPNGKRKGTSADDERWYYNPGSAGLLRVLRFNRGKLSNIDTAGYGFRHAVGRCTPADLRYGMSVYELTARCGKPKNKRLVASGTVGGKHRRGVRQPRTEIWTYDFGAQYLLQKVTLVDAQLDSVATASRREPRGKRR